MTRTTALLLTLLVLGTAAACSNETYCDVHATHSAEQLCAAPASLSGQCDNRAQHYIVGFQDSVDAVAETERLSSLYGFVPAYVFSTSFPGFSAALRPRIRDQLRCEAPVQTVEFNDIVTIN